jgi:SAM-dependent methyltransferase
VTVWNSAEFTHNVRQVNWMASVAVLMHLNERATGDPARDWLSSWAHRWFVGDKLRVLVLGCGEGWLERTVAQWPFVARIDASDAAAEAVARARAMAPPNVHYTTADLNVAELEPDANDVVVAHSVLHHVENLEHCLAQIERAMKRDATLIINEYVGPNRFQFGDDILAIINELLVALGYPPRERPPVEQVIAADPTEAVRSEELMPMLAERFEILEQKALGGTVLMHLLYDIVQDFRWENARERSIVDMLCTFEGALVDAGAIPSDFVIAAARKRGSRVTRSNRPLPPPAEATRDIEPDPLRFLRPRRRQAAALQRWQLRILRLVVLAKQPGRANLFKESRIRGFLARRTSIREQTGDATIRALLDAFDRIGDRLETDVAVP